MSVSLQQPMRPAEIALVELANANEATIAQEIAERKAADITLQNNIDAEETARKAADTTLQNNIDAEASARKAADTTLQANIDAEASARKAADATLQNNIDAEETVRKAADTTLQANIDAEASARKAADATLQAGIDEVNAKFPVTTGSIADNAITSDKIADGAINTIDLNTGIQNQLSFLASVPDLEFGTTNSFDVSASSYYDCTVTFTAKTEAPIVLCELQHTAGNMTCIVTDVTNQQFNARVFNLTTVDITGVTLDWLTISRR